MKTKLVPTKIVDKKNSIFWELFFPKSDASEWLPLINHNKKSQSFNAGDRIFTEGDPAEGIYLLTSGKVKVVSLYDKNSERILRLASEGQILGHRAIGQVLFPISAIALTECTTLFIPKDVLSKLIRGNPDFSEFLINFLATEMLISEERMKNMIHHDVKMRIAEIICMSLDAFGCDEKGKLGFTLSRKDFANIAGTTYESAIRTLFQIQELGVIELVKKTIVVKKENELRKVAGQKIIK